MAMSRAVQRLVNLFSLREEQDLGRRRLQQKGDLYSQSGWWKLRWKEDQVDKNGAIRYAWSKPVVIGPSEGRGKFTETQARRMAWENHLSRLDRNMRTPQSIMTVREFVECKFIPEHVAMLKPGGQAHYDVQLRNVLDGIQEVKRQSRKKPGKRKVGPRPELPPVKRHFGLGDMRLRDVTTEDCQKLVSAALTRRYSVQYAVHIRNTISAIFTHAESKDWFNGRNPAKRVKLPEMQRTELHALTFDQVTKLMAAVDPFSRTLILCAVLTSMNIAEILGLRWRRINLTDLWATVDGEALVPMHIAVREHWYLGQYGSLKAGSRRRNVPIPEELAEMLRTLYRRDNFTGDDDPVFASTKGLPVSARDIMDDRIRPFAKALGMPWLGWHSLRRTFATLGDEVGMSSGERQAMMGHSDGRMTGRYTKTPTEQARRAVDKMAKLISGRPN